MFGKREFDSRGREIPDNTPMVAPMRRQPSLTELIRASVREEFSRQAHEAGMETFEEADDFDVDDDEPELESQYVVVDTMADGPEGETFDAAPPPDPKKRRRASDTTETTPPAQGVIPGVEPVAKAEPGAVG